MDDNAEIKRRKNAPTHIHTAADDGKLAAASSSSTSSSSSSAVCSVPHNTATGRGFTEDGQQFDAPETLNTAEVFLPQNLSLGSGLSAICILTAAYLTFFGGYSKWLHMAIFFFWRVSYNVGLGAILSEQSKHKRFQKWYLRHYGDGSNWKAQLFDHLARRQLAPAVREARPIESFPQCYRAWLVYKNLVSIILVNDGFTYLLLGIKCFAPPPALDLLTVGQYLVGLFLCLFNWWAKVDAHRCIGSYCWFWGDFFFRKDLHLTFDGIFELFPHPMYTVGYSLYYGYSLILRSYTMLFVSLIAHGLQLAFLFFVEEPHIKRTYGSPPAIDKSKARVLYDPKSGLFPDKSDSVFLLDLDLFRSGDFAVVLFAIYAVSMAFVPSDPQWALAQVLLWRGVHWLGLGTVLWGQSNFQLWTRHFTTRGRTLYEAFGHWKSTYNLSLTMNAVVFMCCALRYAHFSLADLMSPSRMACIAVGLVLLSLSVWSYSSTYAAVGEFGWFYGDFFIPEESYRQSLCYTGIYRFVNNPDCVIGYAGQYGLALLAQSWPVFFLALGSHVANILFLNLVEIPHMQKLYSAKEMRPEGPFPKALKRIQETVLPSGLPTLPAPLKQAQSQIERNFKSEVRKIRSRAMEEVYAVYKKLADARMRAASDGDNSKLGGRDVPTSPASLRTASRKLPPAQDVQLVTPSHITLGESLRVAFSAAKVPREQADDTNRPRAAKITKSKSSYDWIGVYGVDTSSSPGVSDGKWQYVEPSDDGEVVFPPTLLPSVEGVYEARYHRNNGYTVVAAHPFILQAEDAEEASPQPSPTPEDAEEEQESKQ